MIVNHRLSQDHREPVLASIKRAKGKAIAIHSDVSDPDSVAEMYSEVKRRFGALDILVNTAGVSDRTMWNLSIQDTTLEMWKKVFAVDAFGTFLCTQGAVGLMKKGSSVVNVASTPALVGDMDGLVYASAKGAVVSMTRMLAKSLAPIVRVNCMAFGSIRTGWMEWLSESQLGSYLKAIPMRRFGSPKDAANLALFLASDESSFITGQVIILDGGEAMR